MVRSQITVWLYASRCALPWICPRKAVENIVTQSIPLNASLEVTGALLYTGTRFVQFLEGPAEGVAFIRKNIRADIRHYDVVTLLSGQRTERIFSNRPLAYAGPSLWGTPDVDQVLHDRIQNASEIINLLEQFVIISEANQ